MVFYEKAITISYMATRQNPKLFSGMRIVRQWTHNESGCDYEKYSILDHWNHWPQEKECEHCWVERERETCKSLTLALLCKPRTGKSRRSTFLRKRFDHTVQHGSLLLRTRTRHKFCTTESSPSFLETGGILTSQLVLHWVQRDRARGHEKKKQEMHIVNK